MGISCQKGFLALPLPEGVTAQRAQHRAAVPAARQPWHCPTRGALVQEIRLAENCSFCSLEQKLEPRHFQKKARVFWPSATWFLFSWAHKSERTVPVAVRSKKNTSALNRESKTWMLASDLLKLQGILQRRDRKTELMQRGNPSALQRR